MRKVTVSAKAKSVITAPRKEWCSRIEAFCASNGLKGEALVTTDDGKIIIGTLYSQGAIVVSTDLTEMKEKVFGRQILPLSAGRNETGHYLPPSSSGKHNQ